MKAELVEVDVEGARLLLLDSDTDCDIPYEAGSLRLLPHFDCYLRGFHPREQLTGGHAERAAGGTGRFPVLLIDGRVAGVWERRARGRRLEVRVDPFTRLTKELRRQLEAEAATIGGVLEADSELTIGQVEVRAHL
jgi:Winged helix DNA-binding domain